MIPHKEAQKLFDDLKENSSHELPVIAHLSKFETISEYSKSLIQNRVSVLKYADRYALVRTLYKPISIKYPKDEYQ